MKAKKLLSLGIAGTMAVALLAGCSSSGSSSSAASSGDTATSEASAASTTAAGKVYYLNFKPEQDETRDLVLHRTDRCSRHRGDRRFR